MRWILTGLRRDRRGQIALLSAVLVLPIIACVALAVDFGFYIEARSQLNLAADAAAVHAVRQASQLYNSGTTTFADAEAAGIKAGEQWFAAQLGTTDTQSLLSTSLKVNVTYQASPGGFVGDVTYTGQVNNKLGAFITSNWPINIHATAQFTNSYLEFIMMLDNSSSMQIGATDSDMLHMMQITPCYWANALYPGQSTPKLTVGMYSHYRCSGNGINYAGNLPCPVTVTSPYTYSTLPIAPTMLWDYTGGPSCKGWLPATNGKYPTAGPPCAFACHEDGSKPAGQGTDLYALARSTIGSANPITLRFDLLKKATNAMLSKMATANAASGNMTVGINTFSTGLTRVYPTNAEAGNDFAAAIAAVGAPPTAPNQPDTGIQPDAFVTAGAHADTDFPTAMTALAKIATAAGDGTTALAPRKVLIIITDGLDDYNGGAVVSGFDFSKCTLFKNMGYTVYVVYTPYYPLIWYWYYINQAAVVQGTGQGSITYNLQQCASNSSAYIQASDATSLNSALQSILAAAQTAATQIIK